MPWFSHCSIYAKNNIFQKTLKFTFACMGKAGFKVFTGSKLLKILKRLWLNIHSKLPVFFSTPI
jgi:hypothetical protein